jgi:hypothetical protein
MFPSKTEVAGIAQRLRTIDQAVDEAAQREFYATNLLQPGGPSPALLIEVAGYLRALNLPRRRGAPEDGTVTRTFKAFAWRAIATRISRWTRVHAWRQVRGTPDWHSHEPSDAVLKAARCRAMCEVATETGFTTDVLRKHCDWRQCLRSRPWRPIAIGKGKIVPGTAVSLDTGRIVIQGDDIEIASEVK